MLLRPLAEDQDSVPFWRTHDRSGRLVAVVGGLVIVAYALATWHGPHRPWLVAIGVVTATVPVAVMSAVDVERAVRSRWGGPYYYVLEATGAAIVVVVAWLDGGVTSPLVLLLLVLLVHGLGAYPLLGTVLTSAMLLSGYLLLHALSAQDPAAAVTGATILAAVAFFGSYASWNHRTLHRHEVAMGRLLRQLADEDHLTGIASRRAFYDALAAASATASATAPISLLLMDVDGFKLVNDEHGHLAGDDLLRRLGTTLRDACRTADVAGRLGGDEFGVLLRHASADTARAVGERIHLAAGSVRLSMGIASATEPCEPEELLAAADRAMYRAKAAGGSCTSVDGTALNV